MAAELRALYRLQLGPGLGFREARELVPYLRELGVSHLYLSPSLEARRGSTHGYDVVDPTHLSVALGGEGAFRELASAGLEIVLDVVPNHMAASAENRFWSDPDLRAKFFDVDTRTGFHRRFFDIGELPALRMEDPAVFEATHAVVLALVEEGLVDGLRIDHPDGLADPAGYLERLRRGGAEHVWVEKILAPGEELREWPVEGTVGYEFLNDVTALFLDPDGAAPLTALYDELTGETRPFAEVALEAKLQAATEIFEPELRKLHQDLDVPNLPLALASFDVYRTYVEPWSDTVHPADREAIAAASLSDRLERILLLEERGHDDFVTRFQQTTGPVNAKGVEDTAFYRYLRLAALNEVGGDPARMSVSVEEFHAANIRRAIRFPRHLLTTQTHDTKRSADVRARIGALTWIAGEWRERVLRWRELNAGLRTGGAPDANEEYLVYQTLVGAWPIELDRLEGYVEKALREAKLHTGWVEPDLEYERAVRAFCERLLAHRPFLDDFEPFAAEVATLGEHAALGQVLLKLTSPGVPDLYNGDELTFLALVDPDNRRPVDWELRRRLLAEVRSGAAPRPETRKLALIARALDLRRRRPDAFDAGYMPLDAGPRVCAFMRGPDVLVVVPLVAGGEGAELELPGAADGRWRDVVTGGERDLAGVVRVAALVDAFPVALLERISGGGRGHTSAVGESDWTPEGWEDRGPSVPERLPRLEDLPVVDRGYDREAVQRAFDSFYRHAAQLDTTLRVLESMEVFARQAGDLRADIRALRAASWGPLPAARPAWRPQAEEARLARGGMGSAALPRLALEAAFIVLVAIGAALADLPRGLIVALVAASWLIVGMTEFVASTRRASLRPALLAEPPAPARSAAPQPEPVVSEATMIEAPPVFDEADAQAPESEPELPPAWPEPVATEEPEPELVEEAELMPEPEPIAEAEPEPESEPEAGAEPEPEPAPAAAVAAAAALSDARPRRSWFRRRRDDDAGVEALAPAPSRHVRVVEPPEPPAEPEPMADGEAGEPSLAEAPEPEPAPEEPVVEVETIEPPPPPVEPEPEPEPPPAEAIESEPQPEPAPVVAAAAEEPEPVGEEAPATTPTEPEEAPRRSWFRRREAAVAPEPEPAPEADSQVERIEVERTVVAEQVEVPWEAELPFAAPASADPWEQGPEPLGIELEADVEPDDEAEAAAPARPQLTERHPQPVRFRRGRR